MSKFSDKLINLRESHDWSKTYVANHIGLKNMQTYANWEYGKSEPDQGMLKELANLFDVTVDYLVDNNQTPEWATEKDTIDLGNFLNGNAKFAYNGSSLTDEEKEKLRIALTQIFWKRHKHGSDAHE
jgi:transcriptional regulator with XRE-family HTH domain